MSRPRRPGTQRRDDRGSMSVELIGVIPALALVTLLVVQGFLAAGAVSSAQAGARDGARAASLGRDVPAAVHAQIPDWVRVERLDRYGCVGECVAVEVRIPVGLPGITVRDLTVTRTAEFPRG